MYFKLLYVLILFYQCFLITQACQSHKTCQDCITDPSVCVWCASEDPSFDGQARCKPRDQVDKNWCSGYVDQPTEPSAKYVPNEKDVETINLKLRVGQPQTFNFSYNEEKDYPVDIYMLLDVSESMTEIQKELMKHSLTIYNTIKNMTKNIQMGFGTFIDKNTQPYTLEVKKRRDKGAYSFKNHLNLTANYESFSSAVIHTAFSSNYDFPESGFDALAQVIACNLSWRAKSRRIVVFLSDSIQHMVSDGRSGGITLPFDGNCHLDNEGYYSKELEMDYPSLPTLNRLVIENDVTIIFAVKTSATSVRESIEEHFQNLKKLIRGSKVSLLNEQGLLVKMLRESYEEISSNLKLAVNNSDEFELKFDPDCTTNINDERCKVEPDSQIDFTGTIKLKKYTGKDKHSMVISIQGTKEKYTLNVDVIKCACETLEATEHVAYCNGQKRQCGVCICDGKFGARCMCDKDKIEDADDDSRCKTNVTSGSACNGRGKCRCGECLCNVPYFGPLCECNRRLCPGSDQDGSLCSDHGNCQCHVDDSGLGKEICSCNDGWTHRPYDRYSPGPGNCSCQSSTTEMCVRGGKLCNNRGNCTCNECVCEANAIWDKRPYHDDYCRMKPCPECHSIQCSSLLDCVRCQMDTNCNKCQGIDVIKFESIPEEIINNTEWKLCENQKLNLGCYAKYVYQYDDDNNRILVRMQEKADCAESYYTYGGVLLVTLLAVGILTLLAWKCLTQYYDRKEYEKFEREHKEDLYDVCYNATYIEPITTIRNPVFEEQTKI